MIFHPKEVCQHVSNSQRTMIFFTTMMGLHLGWGEAFNSHALDIQISPEKVFQVYIWGSKYLLSRRLDVYGSCYTTTFQEPLKSLTNLEEAQAGIVPPSLVVCSVEKNTKGRFSPTWGAGDCTDVFECLGSHNRDPNT